MIKTYTHKALLLALFLLPLILGSISGYFGIQNVQEWYQTINKPEFTPPNWLFGPVWTALYILMGGSLVLFVESCKKFKKKCCYGFIFFAIQLLCNFIWTPLFFGYGNPLAALFDMLLLLVFLLITMGIFSRTSMASSLLLIPYFFWVCYALLLNWSIVLLN